MTRELRWIGLSTAPLCSRRPSRRAVGENELRRISVRAARRSPRVQLPGAL